MKIILSILSLAFIAACSPKLQNGPKTCFQGKLVKRGICGQRVIQLLSKPSEAVLIAGKWTDSLGNKQYENVFTVANPCDFPASIKEDEVFTFSITTTPGTGCITCYAYTATPRQSNNIVTGCAE